MPRFAILDHDHPSRHWDFLLESGDVLRAWRLLTEPVRGQRIVAEPLPDHRMFYLDYEGPVAGDRGQVVRWDGGAFEWEQTAEDELRLRLEGSRIAGLVTLRRAAGAWSWQWR